MRRISTRKITVSLRLFLSENVMFYFWFVDDWRIYRCESWWKVIDENVECSRAWTKVCLLLGVFVFQDAIQIKSADTLLVCDVGGYGISLFKNKLSIKPLTVSFFVLSSYVADFMVAGGCETFVDKYGKVIIKEGLIRNFLIHLNNLLEFQVISQTHIVAAMDKLTKLKAELNEE